MKIILYDFEVFKFDTLLGCKIINEDGTINIYQTWDLEKIKKFYEFHQDSSRAEALYIYFFLTD